MTELWEHQKKVIERARGESHFALFWEMGTGKSRGLVELLRRDFEKHQRVLRTLILGPPVVVENWRREILKYSKIPSKKIHTLTGPGIKRLGIASEARHTEPDCIFITNYESLSMPRLFELLVKWDPEVLVCDESHLLKNMTAKRTKLAIKLADIARYRYLLTGTPVLNSLLDLYSQFRILDRGDSFGKNFIWFRNQYFYDRNAGKMMQQYWPDWRLKPNMESVIGEIVSKKAMYVAKKDCLDLPPLVRKTVYVELSGEQKKAYNEMKKNFVTFVNDKACTADLAITKGLRLQQIVSGFVRLNGIDGEDTETLSLKENPRAEALKELLASILVDHLDSHGNETPPRKVIVWACFRENYEQIRKVCESSKYQYVELHGETPPKKRQENIDAFHSDPNVRVLIGNQGSGGIGVNLVAADVAIYYSRDFSLAHDLQSEARNYRGGSEIHEKITRIDLVARETIDEHILEALANKQDISDKVLREVARKL